MSNNHLSVPPSAAGKSKKSSSKNIKLEEINDMDLSSIGFGAPKKEIKPPSVKEKPPSVPPSQKSSSMRESKYHG